MILAVRTDLRACFVDELAAAARATRPDLGFDFGESIIRYNLHAFVIFPATGARVNLWMAFGDDPESCH